MVTVQLEKTYSMGLNWEIDERGNLVTQRMQGARLPSGEYAETTIEVVG